MSQNHVTGLAQQRDNALSKYKRENKMNKWTIGFGAGLITLVVSLLLGKYNVPPFDSKASQEPTPVVQEEPRRTHIPVIDMYESVQRTDNETGERYHRVEQGGIHYRMLSEDMRTYENIVDRINRDLDAERHLGTLQDGTTRRYSLREPELEHLIRVINQNTTEHRRGMEVITTDEMSAFDDAYATLADSVRKYRADVNNAFSIGDVILSGMHYGRRPAEEQGPRGALCYFVQGTAAQRPAGELLEEIEERAHADGRLPTETRPE